MKDYTLYDNALLIDKSFPLLVYKYSLDSMGSSFDRHWHSQIEIIFVTSGKGIWECDSKVLDVDTGDIILINSNEIHWGTCLQPPFSYYIINIDTDFLKSNYDGNCEQKYITPIFDNRIIFKNILSKNSNVNECVDQIVKEYENQEIGYELYVKSLVYKLLALLVRNNIERILPQKEYETRIKTLNRLKPVLEYIDKNYVNKITIDELAYICCMSRYHFCHVFKKLTGKTVSEYINCVRIDKAELLLRNTDMQVTEISMSLGFNDSTYFCRLFRKYKKLSPTMLREQ